MGVFLCLAQTLRVLSGRHRAHVTKNPAKNATFSGLFAPEAGECCILCNNLGEFGFKRGNIARNVAQSATLSRKQGGRLVFVVQNTTFADYLENSPPRAVRHIFTI